MPEIKTQIPTGEQIPTTPIDILSPAKALAHWQLDHDIADAVAANTPEKEIAVLQFKKTIIDTPFMSGNAVRANDFYEDHTVLKRVKEFKETHGIEEDLDPYSVRVELAARARWSLSGRNPDDYSERDREYIERDWSEMAARQREIEGLIKLQTRDYTRLDETFADAKQVDSTAETSDQPSANLLRGMGDTAIQAPTLPSDTQA